MSVLLDFGDEFRFCDEDIQVDATIGEFGLIPRVTVRTPAMPKTSPLPLPSAKEFLSVSMPSSTSLPLTPTLPLAPTKEFLSEPTPLPPLPLQPLPPPPSPSPPQPDMTISLPPKSSTLPLSVTPSTLLPSSPSPPAATEPPAETVFEPAGKNPTASATIPAPVEMTSTSPPLEPPPPPSQESEKMLLDETETEQPQPQQPGAEAEKKAPKKASSRRRQLQLDEIDRPTLTDHMFGHTNIGAYMQRILGQKLVVKDWPDVFGDLGCASSIVADCVAVCSRGLLVDQGRGLAHKTSSQGDRAAADEFAHIAGQLARPPYETKDFAAVAKHFERSEAPFCLLLLSGAASALSFKKTGDQIVAASTLLSSHGQLELHALFNFLKQAGYMPVNTLKSAESLAKQTQQIRWSAPFSQATAANGHSAPPPSTVEFEAAPPPSKPKPATQRQPKNSSKKEKVHFESPPVVANPAPPTMPPPPSKTTTTTTTQPVTPPPPPVADAAKTNGVSHAPKKLQVKEVTATTATQTTTAPPTRRFFRGNEYVTARELAVTDVGGRLRGCDSTKELTIVPGEEMEALFLMHETVRLAPESWDKYHVTLGGRHMRGPDSRNPKENPGSKVNGVAFVLTNLAVTSVDSTGSTADDAAWLNNVDLPCSFTERWVIMSRGVAERYKTEAVASYADDEDAIEFERDVFATCHVLGSFLRFNHKLLAVCGRPAVVPRHILVADSESLTGVPITLKTNELYDRIKPRFTPAQLDLLRVMMARYYKYIGVADQYGNISDASAARFAELRQSGLERACAERSPDEAARLRSLASVLPRYAKSPNHVDPAELHEFMELFMPIMSVIFI